MAPECRHIKTSGGKCGSPALRGQPYCYFHARLRERAARQQPGFLPFAFQNLEDRGAIQHAICEVAMALADHRLDAKRASILVYALQLASQNTKYAEQIVSSQAVAELTRTEDGEELAPEGATSHPQEEESLAAMLMREIGKQREANKELSPDQPTQTAENKELSQKYGGEGVSRTNRKTTKPKTSTNSATPNHNRTSHNSRVPRI
jgi:hypothetical protein